MTAWAWYKSILSKHPLVTKATTAGGLMSLSDIVCQMVEISMYQEILVKQGPSVSLQGGCPTNIANAIVESNPAATQRLIHWNWQRTLHVGLTGLTFSGPISHAWYGILERFVSYRVISHRLANLSVKMILDAMLFSPIAVGGYFLWRSVLEQKSWEELQRKLDAKWAPAVVASWSFWPAANVM